MVKKSVARVAQRARTEDKAHRTSDSFQNWIAKLGYGQNNQLTASNYVFNYLTRNRTQLEAMYRTNWLVRAAVDSASEDMTQAGIYFEGTIAPDDADLLQSSMMDYQIWQQLCDTIRWSRLFGGCIAVMLIDGQDVNTPLNLDSIGAGSFKGLLVLDRWLVQPNLSDLVTDYGPDLGHPKFYNVISDAQALANMNIHHTRVLRMDGMTLPYYQKLVEMGWGESILEVFYDRLLAYDSATMGAAQLLFKSHLRTLKIDQYRDILSTGGTAYTALMQQIELLRLMQTNEGMTVLDLTDEFEVHRTTFAGIDDILLSFAQQVSGSLQIPLIRLLGQSPAGLNSSGESDLRTYYDNVRKTQEQKLRRPLTRLLDVMARSLEIELPDDFSFHFNPLWMLTETEKAEIAAKDATTVGTALEGNMISQATALKELRQLSRVNGRFTNISDKDIADADQEVPSAEEMMQAMNQPAEGQNPDEDKKPVAKDNRRRS
jgi:phage-related protein (TIGR01555 family)